MPKVFPFQAVQYKRGHGDVSTLVAPPYDVLDSARKKKLLDKNGHNVVAIDLPHTPAKELGPTSAYMGAADLYRKWLSDGTLDQSNEPAMFAYRQTFTAGDKTWRRSGMAITVETVPFGPRPGGGVLPHEETFSGPKEDRFALMKATKAQLSPIFGLHADEHGSATRLIQMVTSEREADLKADMGDGVLHEVWKVTDPAQIKAYQDALIDEDVFIADGHHRYTTGLNYLKLLEEQGSVPSDHPARRCMMVLVGMSDPGLVIWPTHRVLGGMKNYTFDAFKQAASGDLKITAAGNDIHQIEAAMKKAAAAAGPEASVFGLYDFATKSCAVATLADPDPLRKRFGAKPEAWRKLDVALIQYIIVEQICQPKLNGGEPVKWAFPHTIDEVVEIGSGAETGAGGGANFAQLAVIVRPTPLHAVKEVSRANELMPQKSTFFFPKLATGLFINPLA